MAPFSARASAPLSSALWPPPRRLVRPTQRFLQGESQRPHQPADVRRMVTDAELLADHLGHSRAGPHLSSKAMRAGAPRARSSGSLARSSSLRRALAPGGGLCLRASTPSSFARFIHWLTAPLLTPKARAISCCFQPSCLSSHARSRRPSRQSVASWLDSVFPMRLTISKFRCFRRDQ